MRHDAADPKNAQSGEYLVRAILGSVGRNPVFKCVDSANVPLQRQGALANFSPISSPIRNFSPMVSSVERSPMHRSGLTSALSPVSRCLPRFTLGKWTCPLTRMQHLFVLHHSGPLADAHLRKGWSICAEGPERSKFSLCKHAQGAPALRRGRR
eukprot:1857443-Rhodomonas_salina.1